MRGRLLARSGVKRGLHTGPSPVDRGRAGSKHHVITDGQGTPLAVLLTGGNRNDVTQLLPLLDAVPPVRGRVGHPAADPIPCSPTAATTSMSTATRSAAAASFPPSPDAEPCTGPAWAATGGWSSEPSPGYTASAGSASAGKDGPTSTKLSCCLISHRQLRLLCEPPIAG
jgi:hypothetical protein